MGAVIAIVLWWFQERTRYGAIIRAGVAAAGMDTPRGKLTFKDNQAYGPLFISEIGKSGSNYTSNVVYSGTMQPPP